MMAWIKRFDRDDAIKIGATLVLVGSFILLFLLGRSSAEDAVVQSERADQATVRANEGEYIAQGIAETDVCEDQKRAAKVGMASLCLAAASLAEEAEEEPLHGLDGADGVDGQDGADGLDGADGADGEDGKPGTPGSPGSPGTDGLNGQDGANGEDGEDGQPGTPGAPGSPGADGADGKDGANGTSVSDVEVRCVDGGGPVEDTVFFVFTLAHPDGSTTTIEEPEGGMKVDARAC